VLASSVQLAFSLLKILLRKLRPVGSHRCLNAVFELMSAAFTKTTLHRLAHEFDLICGLWREAWEFLTKMSFGHKRNDLFIDLYGNYYAILSFSLHLKMKLNCAARILGIIYISGGKIQKTGLVLSFSLKYIVVVVQLQIMRNLYAKLYTDRYCLFFLI